MSAVGARRRLPLGRRVAYALVMVVLFLGLAELGLRAIPDVRAWLWRVDVAGDVTLLFIGDSVTAGFGVAPTAAWPQRVIDTLRAQSDVAVGGQVYAGMGARLRAIDAAPVRDGSGAPFGVALVMLGHNDFVNWDDQVMNSGTPDLVHMARPAAAPTPWEPRLLRVWRWGRSAWTPVPPSAALPEFLETLVRTQLRALRARLAPTPVVVLTYVLPGAPPTDAEPGLAAFLTRTAELQRAGNTLLRTVAAEEGMAVIDVAERAAAPAVWSRDDFIDNIHPTERQHDAIAASVVTGLGALGLPASVGE